jgi:hypothetical protein
VAYEPVHVEQVRSASLANASQLPIIARSPGRAARALFVM